MGYSEDHNKKSTSCFGKIGTLVKSWHIWWFIQCKHMPRKARIDAPGALHHIVIRGIERKPLFKDSQDYQNFIERIGNILTESSTPCFAWVLMTNHCHLLLRTGLAPISTVMRRLLTGYAHRSLRCLPTEFDTVCGQQACKPRAFGIGNQKNCQRTACSQLGFSCSRRLESNLLSV